MSESSQSAPHGELLKCLRAPHTAYSKIPELRALMNEAADLIESLCRSETAPRLSERPPLGRYVAPFHGLEPFETDTKLIAAWTPARYAGHYPPYLNFTMVRMDGSVVLTVRLPTVAGQPAGETAAVRFHGREQWREFVQLVEQADKVWKACDALDAEM